MHWSFEGNSDVAVEGERTIASSDFPSQMIPGHQRRGGSERELQQRGQPFAAVGGKRENALFWQYCSKSTIAARI